MDTELKRIKKLTAFMIKSGLSSLKSGDLELNLAPHVFHAADPSPVSPRSLATDTTPPTSNLTEEDILFWSSPGLALPTEEAN